MARYEARVAAAADTTSVVSERDRLASPGLRPPTVIPNGVALDDLAYAEPAERAPVALFFGNLGYFHNVAPARLAALDVLPAAFAGPCRSASLRIAGARPAAAGRGTGGPGRHRGRPDVPSMAAELHRAAVAILPASSGSGIKNKVLEAFAAGTPVVTNRARNRRRRRRPRTASTISRPREPTRWPRRPRGCSPTRTSASGSPRPPGLWSSVNTAGSAAPDASSSSMAWRTNGVAPGRSAARHQHGALELRHQRAVLLEDARVHLHHAAVRLRLRRPHLEHLATRRTACRRGTPAPGARAPRWRGWRSPCRTRRPRDMPSASE